MTSFRAINDGPQYEGEVHSRVRIFAGPDEDHRAYCGTLTMLREEAGDFELRVNGLGRSRRLDPPPMRPVEHELAAAITGLGLSGSPLWRTLEADNPAHRDVIQELIERRSGMVVNLLRDGISIGSVVDLCECPLWLVLRLGRDAGLLRQKCELDVPHAKHADCEGLGDEIPGDIRWMGRTEADKAMLRL